jgi:integrase
MSDDTGERGGGRLVVRISRTGGTKKFYFQYTRADGKRAHWPIGDFTLEAKPGAFTLKEGRAEAARLRVLHQQAEARDLHGYFKRQAEQAQAAEAERLRAEQAARDAREAAHKYTLKALAATYVAYLEKRGKQAAYDARNLFANHLDCHPLAAKPAREVAAKEVAQLLRGLAEAGKGRTAAKLRSYVHAAYALAIKAELDPSAPVELANFGVAANPVAATSSLSEFNRARDRVLSDIELRAYWSRLADIPSDPIRAVLRVALLLGGQRPAQLVRLKRVDVDLDGGFLTLFDGKGARKQPRRHELPVSPWVKAELAPLVARAESLKSEWVFTSDGTAPVHSTTVAAVAAQVAAAMLNAEEARASFCPSDLRRTCETLLAKMQISKDVRAQIQSHGLGGVQARHYDRHDYRKEKAAALAKWQAFLTRGRSSGQVVDIRTARSA